MELIKEANPKARKNHDCDACHWVLHEGINRMGYTRPELRVLSKARKSNWQILKGDKYLRQLNRDIGDLVTFKAIPEVHKICLKYNLYPD